MTNASPATPNPIEAILRQVEMQQLQLKMEVLFKKNMVTLEQQAKPLYDKFCNYKPTELQLNFTESGFLDLINSNTTKGAVYRTDPKQFSENQFQEFIEKPRVACINYQKTKIVNDKQIHPEATNKLIDHGSQITHNDTVKTNVPIGLMIVTGIGMGYHLELIIKHLNVKSICLFEPQEDSFYASLHTIDWSLVFQNFSHPGKMLKLYIGVDGHHAINDMAQLRDSIGLHNITYSFLYRHLSSKKENDFMDLYKKSFHLFSTGLGFFDDEQIGLAHTIHNMKNGLKVFNHRTSDTKELPPAFLLGNGPSLDEHIEYIKKNKDNVILFTCGTAISSLYKTGIKPDFHIEIERDAVTPSYIKHGTSQEYRKGIPLLCLNTASPDMVELFDQVYFALKPNDIGTIIFDHYHVNHSFKPLEWCNPTVTNAGLAYAIAMGFKQIILLGIDLGVRDDGAHHSELSIYKDLEKKLNRTGFSPTETANGQSRIPGNFGGEISTNPTLHKTKNNMEELIEVSSKSKTLSIFNPNNGALISGAIPTQQSKLPKIKTELNKKSITEHILNHCFTTTPEVDISTKSIETLFLNAFRDTKKQLEINADIDNVNDLTQELDRIFSALGQLKSLSPESYALLKGTLSATLALILKPIYFTQNKTLFKRTFNESRKIYMESINAIYEFMERSPLLCDTTSDKDAVQLEIPESSYRQK